MGDYKSLLIKVAVVGGVGVGGYFAIKKFYNGSPFSFLFGVNAPTKEEKQKLREIMALDNDGERTITDFEAKERADMIYHSVKGGGTYEDKLFKGILNKDYWHIVDEAQQEFDKLSSLNFGYGLDFLWTAQALSIYKRNELHVALTDSDLIQIVKEFGIRNGHTGYYTLPEYVSSDGDLLDVYNHAFRGTIFSF